MPLLLMRVLPRWLIDVFVELAGHWKTSRDIDQAIAAGDREAFVAFTTGTFAAAFTRRGLYARGDEFVEYARLVLAKDGACARYHCTFADPDQRG